MVEEPGGQVGAEQGVPADRVAAELPVQQPDDGRLGGRASAAGPRGAGPFGPHERGGLLGEDDRVLAVPFPQLGQLGCEPGPDLFGVDARRLSGSSAARTARVAMTMAAATEPVVEASWRRTWCSTMGAFRARDGTRARRRPDCFGSGAGCDLSGRWGGERVRGWTSGSREGLPLSGRAGSRPPGRVGVHRPGRLRPPGTGPRRHGHGTLRCRRRTGEQARREHDRERGKDRGRHGDGVGRRGRRKTTRREEWSGTTTCARSSRPARDPEDPRSAGPGEPLHDLDGRVPAGRLLPVHLGVGRAQQRVECARNRRRRADARVDLDEPAVDADRGDQREPSRAATSAAMSAVAPGSRTTNSSPPSRATRSPSRACARSRAATTRQIHAPTSTACNRT